MAVARVALPRRPAAADGGIIKGDGHRRATLQKFRRKYAKLTHLYVVLSRLDVGLTTVSESSVDRCVGPVKASCVADRPHRRRPHAAHLFRMRRPERRGAAVLMSSLQRGPRYLGHVRVRADGKGSVPLP